MDKKIPDKGRTFRSSLTPLNVSLIPNARKKSPRKTTSKKAKKGKSYGGAFSSNKTRNSNFSGYWKETQVASTSEKGKVTTPQDAAETAPQLQSKRESTRKNNPKLTLRKDKNTKSKSCGGTLNSYKTKTSSSGSWEETQGTSTASEEHKVAALEEASEPSAENNSELAERKIEDFSKSDSEKHPLDASFVIEKSEAGLPKIDKQTKGEDSKPEGLSNQTNSFNEKPNQPKSSIAKNCDLTPFVCIADSVNKNKASNNFRNKRLDRGLNPHDESLFKLSRATKLTGTINKERRNIERQQEKNLKNVTIRRKCPKPAIELTNETIRIDEKNTCSSLIKKPILRSKMPDFSAIHQQNFGKMESIVDHLDRKARRAIVLTTSTVKKAKPDMKKKSTEKTSIIKHLGCRAQRTLALTPSTTRKASLDMTDSNTTKVSKSTYFAVRQQANSKSETPKRTKDVKLKCIQKLDNKFDKTKLENEPTQENINISQKSGTKFDKKNAKEKATDEIVNILPIVEVSKAKVEELNSRILDKRRLYKGKIEAGGENRLKKNVEILRGVRSNRRFELQMKYRNDQK